MPENSNISWTDHTASPWYGCSHGVYTDASGNEVEHPGCQNCYAEAQARRNPRTLGEWGRESEGGTRVRSKSFWANCERWNTAARNAGKKCYVFPSICDPFEEWEGVILNNEGAELWTDGAGHYNEAASLAQTSVKTMRPATMNDLRRDLFALIDRCEDLIFLLLTKRPGNIRKMWPENRHTITANDSRRHTFRENVYLITSISDQATADALVPLLLDCRGLAPVLGLSAEPLLGPIRLVKWFGPQSEGQWMNVVECGHKTQQYGINWVISGGESGAHHRDCNPEWQQSLRDQCQEAGVPFFCKQDSGRLPGTKGRLPLELFEAKEFPVTT